MSSLRLYACAGLLLVARSALALDATIDSSFGSGGAVALDWSGGRMRPTAIAIDPDGRIALAGEATPVDGLGNARFVVTRLLPDGARDAAFARDANGYRTYAFGLGAGTATAIDTPSAVVAQDDGKLLVAGTTYFTPSAQMAAIRLDANGDLDPAFGDGGAAHFGGAWTTARGAVIDGAGRALLFGADRTLVDGHPEVHAALARLTANGRLDASFDGDGVGNYSIIGSSYATEEAGAVALDRAGEICLVANFATDVPEGAGAVQVDSDGRTNDSLSHSARTVLPVDVTRVGAAAAADGGRTMLAAQAHGALALLRLRAGGALDPTFGVSGIARLALPFPAYPLLLARTHAGGWLVVLQSSSLVVARFTAAGAPDRSFGDNGLLSMPFPGASWSFFTAAALDTQGRLVATTPLIGYKVGVMRVLVDTDTLFADEFDGE